MTGDAPRLLIEPVVEWPRHAETESDYLVTIDLRGPLPTEEGEAPSWPYPDEEFTFSVTLDGSPHFVCTALNEPSVVLHRFGGTYGEARFRVSTGGETGAAALWLTVSNQWGVPVRKAELRSEIRERDSEATRRTRQVEVVREPPPAPPPPLPSAPPQRSAPQTPERPGRAPEDEERPRERTPEVREQPGESTPEVREQPGESTPEVREQPGESTPEVQRRPRRWPWKRTAAPPGRPTVTISFAGFNRAWAAWIGDRLERRGHRVVYQ
ncbi:hypothetical protein ACFY0T_50175, partial [Streptomyces sp. NPDC001530]